MGKIYTPTSINGGNQTQTTLNQNFSDIEVALEDVLSRSGAAPNTMSDVFDLNSNRAINGSDAINPTDLVTLRQITDTGLLPGQDQVFVGTTVNTQVISLALVPISEKASILLNVEIVGAGAGSSEQFAYSFKVLVYRDGVNPAAIQGSSGTIFEVESDASADATILVVGNDVVVQVTGVAAQTIQWKAAIKTTEQAGI